MSRAAERAVASLRRWWWAVLIGGVIVLAIVAGVVLSMQVANSVAPLLEQAALIPDQKDRIATIKDISQYQIDNQIKIWTGLVQAVGVVALAVGGVVGLLNLRATQAKLDIDRDGQITNRLTQAVGQLGAELKDGKPNLEVRLGGIYALERIALDSPRDHWTIMEILTAYVRENAPWPPSDDSPAERGTESGVEVKGAPQVKPRIDIQAILTVLGRRVISEAAPEKGQLNLSGTDFRGADLSGGEFARVDLHGSHLENSMLLRVNLEGGNLGGVHLEGAYVSHARLRSADLGWSHLEGAQFYVTHLQGAFFGEAHLDGAMFRRTPEESALFPWETLEQASLHSAHGLTQEQIQHAHEGGKGARLPIYLTGAIAEQAGEGSIAECDTPSQS